MIREIIQWPDKRLNDVSNPVTDYGPDFQKLIDDLLETMYDADGLGLAAIQIGVPLRVFVSCAGRDQVYVNPEITSRLGRECKVPEGCLSMPGIFEEVRRFPQVCVAYENRFGERAYEDTGLLELVRSDKERLAQVIQHETEHIDGRIFVDHLSLWKRDQIRKKLRKKR